LRRREPGGTHGGGEKLVPNKKHSAHLQSIERTKGTKDA